MIMIQGAETHANDGEMHVSASEASCCRGPSAQGLYRPAGHSRPRDAPAAIQIVPRQVIEDQQATRMADVVENVSSVRPGSTFGNRSDSFIVRGFQSFLSARDGFLFNQLFGVRASSILRTSSEWKS